MKKLYFFPLLLLLAGCWDSNQSERMYYIHGLGFDYQDEQYKIYAQVIDFTNIAKSEQPNPEARQVEIGTSEGRTFEEAFFHLYNSMDERLFFGHLNYVIFSENILKEKKVEPIVNSFIRYRELRYTTWAYVTKSSINEIMSTTPILNKSITLSKLSDPINSFKQSSLIKPIDFRELMIQLDEPGHVALIPFVEIGDNWALYPEKDTIHKFNGITLFSQKNGLEGYLFDDNVRGLQWMNEKTIRSQVTFKHPGFDDPYFSVTARYIKPDIRPIVTDSGIQFDITVSIAVQVSEVPDTKEADKINEEIKKQIIKEIETTYKAGLEQDSDVYRLSEIVYRKEFKAWKQFHEDGKIPLNESSIRSLNIELKKIKSERTITKNEEEEEAY